MGCGSCGTTNGTPNGCGNKGYCSSGGCNRLNTFDWLSKRNIPSVDGFDIVELSFKNGSRKDFYHLPRHINAETGDMVVVNLRNGYDVGRISLKGELVRLQMKKKKVSEDFVTQDVLRIAHAKDIENLEKARKKDIDTLIRTRAIIKSKDIQMKLGDVEFQADQKKATFYYTAEGRIDFRELVRLIASEFRIKVEMKQIGSRQESAKIGGVGSCGRELCCSTWLSNFKSVPTSAPRYQAMAINQTKLTGKCGRLKCCLNYELDTYIEAVSGFPKNADMISTKEGKAHLIKIDIFKGIMFYSVEAAQGRNKFLNLDKERVKEILAMNKKNILPDTFIIEEQNSNLDEFKDYEDVIGAVELPSRRKSRGKRRRPNHSKNQNNRSSKPSSSSQKQKSSNKNMKSNNNRNKKRNTPNKSSNKGNNSK